MYVPKGVIFIICNTLRIKQEKTVTNCEGEGLQPAIKYGVAAMPRLQRTLRIDRNILVHFISGLGRTGEGRHLRLIVILVITFELL